MSDYSIYPVRTYRYRPQWWSSGYSSWGWRRHRHHHHHHRWDWDDYYDGYYWD